MRRRRARQGGEREHSILKEWCGGKDSRTAVSVLAAGSVNLSSSLNLFEPQFLPW